MKLPEFGVKRPVMTTMIFLALLLLGAISLGRLPIDIMPKISLPTMGVITFYPGASTEDVEAKVTKVIEGEVSTVSNISEVTSTSQENLSAVILRFNWGTNLDEAANEVRQRLDFSTIDLPEDAEKPILYKFDLSMMPILFLGVSTQGEYPDLRETVDKKLCDPLKRLPGVAMTVIRGGHERQIKVEIDRARLDAYHLSIGNIADALAAANLTLPAGDLKLGSKDYNIRIPGEFTSVGEIGDVVVGNCRGVPVHLREIAKVKDSFADIDRRVRIDDRPGLLVLVQKQSGANTVNVAKRVLQALPKLKKGLPPDARISVIMDSYEFIRNSIGNLASTVGWALLFVILVVFLFLWEPKGSLIVALVIPFSLIVSFIFLYFLGYTINIMSLSAIAIAIGMVVDNAIVIYENVFRHRTEYGESPAEASIFGSSEVGLAVTASTITTVAIFFPVIFVGGFTGVMFKQLALVVTIVLSASLLSALTLTPMLASKFLRSTPPEEKRRKVFGRLEAIYGGVLGWALRHRPSTLGIGLLIFVLSLLMLPLVGTEFMPSADQGEFQGTIELPPGVKVEATDQVMRQVEGIVQQGVPERKSFYARCGVSESGIGAMFGQRSDKNIITIGGTLVPRRQRERSDKEIGHWLSGRVAQIPGVKSIDFTPQDFMTMMTSGGQKPLTVEVYGSDLEEANKVARQVREFMKAIPGVTDVTISREEGKPELWVEVDREKASALGLSMAQLASSMRTRFYGQVATKYRERGEEYEVFLRLRSQDRKQIEDLLNAVISSPTGAQVPLGQIATLKERRGPLTLERKDQERVIYVGGNLYHRPLGSVVKELKGELAHLALPAGVEVKISGFAQQQAESFSTLILAFLLGIILVYMIMASQFESLIDPFVIMFSVPFAIVGVIWALLLTGKTLNIISLVGMIMLVGIVVNNAIVLVDYTNILRARGMTVRDAILTACRRRMRPVLMTAFTTIFGLLPLALSRGEGSEIWNPLAVAVIGGLTISTAITLVFVPTLYSIFEEKLKGRGSFGRRGGRR